MKIKTAELETVCGITSTLPQNDLPEVAFCGRSNVGKSSMLNVLMNRKSLARTSGQPGKTQTINFYNVNGEIYFVDLPGYGYAKAAKSEIEKWGDMIENYLTESEQLSAVFQLVDIRHEPSKQDRQMYDWLTYLGFQHILIATKADKIKPREINRRLDEIAFSLGGGDEAGDMIILPYSSETKEGREDILDLISQIIEAEQ